MTNHSGRGRINCAPLGTQEHPVLLTSIPAGHQPLAYVFDNRPQKPFGVLIKDQYGGHLSVWTGQNVMAVNEAKALAALDEMASTVDATAELAAMLRGWRAQAGLTAKAAAAQLGIPHHTYLGIEQGRGFRYPRLIQLALATITKGSG